VYPDIQSLQVLKGKDKEEGERAALREMEKCGG
jgi:hypothetical protein